MNARRTAILAPLALFGYSVWAGQVPGRDIDADIPISHRDRVYAAEQFSNTVSVIDPLNGLLLGAIQLGDPQPGNLSPLYHGQVLVHGLGFSPDHRTLAVVSIGSNSVTFIDTATNEVRHTTYLGRSPHEAFFTQDGREVWVTIRGEAHVAILDAHSFKQIAEISLPVGPGMQIFSPDGKYAYVCSSFSPETVVISVADRNIVGRVAQESPFCPNIAATPDGTQVWFTLKDVGKVQVFDARPPFLRLATLATGPITNHVNFARTRAGTFAYITVGGLNEVRVFRIDTFAQVATIPVGRLPHGCWPSGDGTRVFVGLENDDQLIAIDTSTNTVVSRTGIGQAPQAVVYVPNAVPSGDGLQGLVPLGTAAQATHLSLVATARTVTGDEPMPATSVSLFDQGLTQVVQAAVVGLKPASPYVLALSSNQDGSGPLEPLAAFTTNPAGSAIVNAVGPVRQLVRGSGNSRPLYLAVAPGTPDHIGSPVQLQGADPSP